MANAAPHFVKSDTHRQAEQCACCWRSFRSAAGRQQASAAALPALVQDRSLCAQTVRLLMTNRFSSYRPVAYGYVGYQSVTFCRRS
jgi:hypothetical protein